MFTVVWREPCEYRIRQQKFDLYDDAVEFYRSVMLRTSRVELLDKHGMSLYTW